MKKNTQKKLTGFYKTKANLAREYGVSPQLVNTWFARAMPLKWAKEIEKRTKGFFTRQELVPEIFE